MQTIIARHLYARIWLAAAACVTVLGLLIAWGWHAAEAEHERDRQRERQSATELRQHPMRELIVRDADGRPIGRGQLQWKHGRGHEFAVVLTDGRVLLIQRAPRVQEDAAALPPPPPSPSGGGPHAASDEPGKNTAGKTAPRSAGPRGGEGDGPPFWLRPPFGFLWVIGLAGLAVMAGIYPVARRLTQRLERLQRGVQQWGEGDLAVRLPEDGHDEVADLSRRFNAAAARIQSLMAAQKSLLANASHELRSPLARIRMALELMGERPSPAVRAEVTRNIAELDQLIDEILLASRLDAQEADLGSVESVDLLGLVAEECARTGADFAPASGLHEAAVPGVAKLLRRAVRNLLENAARHGGQQPASATLALEAAPASKPGQPGKAQAVIRVSDHGPGVPPELRERIFEPFYRLPGASEREGGVGLGLALVRAIAHRHRGPVRGLAPPPPPRARVELRLPAHPLPPAPPQPDRTPSDLPRSFFRSE